MKSTIKRITLPAVAVIVCVLSLLMYVNAQAANFADYLPLNTSTRILVTTKGNPGDIGRTYVNRVTGTEQISTTLTTKIGVIPYAPDAYNSFYNITNDGTTVKWWGNQSVTFDPPFSIGIINDGDLTPIFSSNITDRCTQVVSYGEAADSVLIDIRDVTVSGVTYPNAIVEFFIDPDLSAREVNFGANTLGFPSTYLPNSRSPLPGAITGFDIFASGIGLIADGDIDAATGNFVALIELQSIEASPLVGKWGLQSLYHGSIGYTWYAEGGYATFNNDGTGFGICRFNDDGLLGNCTDYNFTWSTTLNPDGTIFLITITNPENETWIDKLALSDDGKMMILDGTEDTTQQSLEIFVRLDSDKSYTNADFSGERYYSRYMHDMAGRHTTCSGISMPDGAGNFTASSTCNQDGVVSSNSGSGHYSVNPDGSFTFIESNISGYLSGDGVCLVNGHVDTPAVWSIAMNLKKQDRTYCTADLAGTWVVSGFL